MVPRAGLLALVREPHRSEIAPNKVEAPTIVKLDKTVVGQHKSLLTPKISQYFSKAEEHNNRYSHVAKKTGEKMKLRTDTTPNRPVEEPGIKKNFRKIGIDKIQQQEIPAEKEAKDDEP